LVQTDYSGIRSLDVKLTSGKEFSYGANVSWEEFLKFRFEFKEGKQLLGAYGKTGEDGALVSLGFFQDVCSDSMQEFLSETAQSEYFDELEEAVDEER